MLYFPVRAKSEDFELLGGERLIMFKVSFNFMYGAYFIPEKCRGKDVELPSHTDPYVKNENITLHIPQNAFYLDIIPMTLDGREISDDFEGEPLLRYFSNNENLIDTQENLLNCDMFSLERRLQLIFERKD